MTIYSQAFFVAVMITTMTWFALSHVEDIKVRKVIEERNKIELEKVTIMKAAHHLENQKWSDKKKWKEVELFNVQRLQCLPTDKIIKVTEKE